MRTQKKTTLEKTLRKKGLSSVSLPSLPQFCRLPIPDFSSLTLVIRVKVRSRINFRQIPITNALGSLVTSYHCHDLSELLVKSSFTNGHLLTTSPSNEDRPHHLLITSRNSSSGRSNQPRHPHLREMTF